MKPPASPSVRTGAEKINDKSRLAPTEKKKQSKQQALKRLDRHLTILTSIFRLGEKQARDQGAEPHRKPARRRNHGCPDDDRGEQAPTKNFGEPAATTKWK